MKAFPSNHDPKTGTMQLGMELRDYFAAKAFQSRLIKHSDWTLDELTDQAYKDADSLMKAREQ